MKKLELSSLMLGNESMLTPEEKKSTTGGGCTQDCNCVHGAVYGAPCGFSCADEICVWYGLN